MLSDYILKVSASIPLTRLTSHMRAYEVWPCIESDKDWLLSETLSALATPPFFFLIGGGAAVSS